MSNTNESPLVDCAGQSEVQSGTLFIRKVRLAGEGESVGGHAHEFDHTTIFLRGSVAIHTYDPRCGCEHDDVAKAGDHMLIEAEVIHNLTALDDTGAEFWCVYADGPEHGRCV